MAVFNELVVGGYEERLGKQYRRCIRAFVVKGGLPARAFSNSLWRSRHPYYTGPYAPRCKAVRLVDNWLPGIAKVIAYYKTMREPGKAKLFVKLGSRPVKATHDIDGEIINGPFHGDKKTYGINYKRITQGPDIVYEPTIRLELQTAYERSRWGASDIATTAGLIGKVNAHKLTNFGNFPRGTLLLLGAPSTHIFDEDDLWYANYVFDYEPKGWNKLTKTQLFCKLPREIPVVADTGALSGDTSRVMIEMPKKLLYGDDGYTLSIAETREADAPMFKYANFGRLEAMLVW